MEGGDMRNRADPDQSRSDGEKKDSSTQTDNRGQRPGPRLSKMNLFTLLSLWMEVFPQQEQPSKEEEEEEEEENHSEIRGVGLVVVWDSKVVGFHCSSPDLHAGQAAIIQHGARLAECQLYFSRRPCATCLKMIINAGVSQISFWPGDPEVSMLKSTSTKPSRHQCHGPTDWITEEAALDAMATEKLKSNSRPHICMLLQPLAPGFAQFVEETSQGTDFMERVADDEPELDTEKIFNREQQRYLKTFFRQFLVETSEEHHKVLTQMGLENICMEPYFSSLRSIMKELVEVLAAVAAGVPHQEFGFYREEFSTGGPSQAKTSLLPCHYEDISQEVARHCMVQARLLAYRTDPKVGVGAVIWAKGQLAGCEGTAGLSLVGCGYNAYPAGSQYGEYPQMDDKQEDRQRRKYRFIIHAEQNALTLRARDIQSGCATMLFVTKCPCDECVPLIRGAGITHVYTSDQDRDKDKGDISYIRFSSLKGVEKFIWQKNPLSSSHLINGYVGKQDNQSTKKQCTSRTLNTPLVS
ncbi:cytidine and dCMP deaminase domain-containing protein 1 isoform X2 [Thalassophryne amazonica]|uniref:cytidine and dCMP deaminase domain-containing protein 1 isoform X2 n=1 Tax=Thalassophryne amazonica TaxID=390379 RepID=UPI0014717FA2|nr:cytidine and dCMP deaminase domain-containing protein 1 isoform X2 [Thalassophryne amazonica]